MLFFAFNVQINCQTVSGKVRDQCTNLPIYGYKLSITRPPYYTDVTTAVDGYYSYNLTGLTSGSWTFKPIYAGSISYPTSLIYTVPSTGPYTNQDYLISNPTSPSFTINGNVPLVGGARTIIVCGAILPTVANTSLFSSYAGGYRWSVMNSDAAGSNLTTFYTGGWSSFQTTIFSDAAASGLIANGNYYKLKLEVKDACGGTSNIKSYIYHILYSKGTLEFRLQNYDTPSTDFPQALYMSSSIPVMGNISGWIGKTVSSSPSLTKYKIIIYEVNGSGAKVGSDILNQEYSATSFPFNLSFSQMFSPNPSYFYTNYGSTAGKTYKIITSLYHPYCGYQDEAYSFFRIKQSCAACIVVSDDSYNDESYTFTAKLQNEIDVFPNPVSDEVNIGFYKINIESISDLKVYSASGNLIKRLSNGTRTVNKINFNLNTSDLFPGIYFFKYGEGKNSSFGKFVKM